MSNVTQYELTPQYYYDIRLRYAVNFCINTVATIIASVLIIWKSTPKMKTYKWLLLDLTICSYLMDFNMTLFYMPVFMFPAPGICSLGIVNAIFGKSPGSTCLPFILLILTLSSCGIALVYALYFRYRTLNNKPTDIFSKKYFLSGMIALHFVGGMPIVIAAVPSFYYIGVKDPDYWWNYMDRNFPSVGQLMHYCQDNDICVCGGVVLETSGTNIMIATILLVYLMYVLLVLLGPCYSYRCLKKQSNNITNKKYNHEKMLILSLFVQSMVPLICYMAPFIYSAVDVIIQFQIPTILTILIQLSTLHSFFNAFTMILLMKPYRRAVRDAFRMKCIFNQVSGSNLVVAVRVNNLVVTNNERTK